MRAARRWVCKVCKLARVRLLVCLEMSAATAAGLQTSPAAVGLQTPARLFVCKAEVSKRRPLLDACYARV